MIKIINVKRSEGTTTKISNIINGSENTVLVIFNEDEKIDTKIENDSKIYNMKNKKELSSLFKDTDITHIYIDTLKYNFFDDTKNLLLFSKLYNHYKDDNNTILVIHKNIEEGTFSLIPKELL
jgi:hypothetical protein